MTIVPIEKIRRAVIAAVHGGADLATAVHAAAVQFGLTPEAVVEALEREDQAARSHITNSPQEQR